MINFKIDFNEIPLKDLISLEGDEDLSEIVPKMVCVLLDFDFLKKKPLTKNDDNLSIRLEKILLIIMLRLSRVT